MSKINRPAKVLLSTVLSTALFAVAPPDNAKPARLVMNIALCESQQRLSPAATLKFTVGASDFTTPYYVYPHFFRFAVKRRFGKTVKVSMQLPEGVYELGIAFADGICTAQDYAAVLAGHTRHIAISTITGAEDPLTVSAAVGEYHFPLSFSIVRFQGIVSCGEAVNIVPHILWQQIGKTSEVMQIEGSAYYFMMPAPGDFLTKYTFALQYPIGRATYYVKLPLQTPAGDEFMNGTPGFVRYDLTEQRFQTLLKLPQETLLCP